MKRLYLYVYRTRRPSGWGRHYGYAGITNAPALRDQQHRAKPWYDLVVKRYVISLGRMPRWLGLSLEWLLIKATMPAYNVHHNRSNPRRIKPWDAKAQRLARDAGHLPYGARLADLALPVVGVVALAAGLWLR